MLRLKPSNNSKRSLSDSEACAVDVEDSFRSCLKTKENNAINLLSAEPDGPKHEDLEETRMLVLSSTESNDSAQIDFYDDIPGECQEIKKSDALSECKHENDEANTKDHGDKNDILEAILGNSPARATDLENLESLELPLNHSNVEHNSLIIEKRDRLRKNEPKVLVRHDADREEGELTPDHAVLADEATKRFENKENEKKAVESIYIKSGNNIQTFLDSFCEKAKEYLKSQTENIQSPVLDSLSVVLNHVESAKDKTAKDSKRSSGSTQKKDGTSKEDARKHVRRSRSFSKTRTETTSGTSKRRSRSETRGKAENTSKTSNRRSRSVTRRKTENVLKSSNRRSRSRDRICETDKFGRIPKRLLSRSRRSSSRDRSKFSRSRRSESKRASSHGRKADRKDSKKVRKPPVSRGRFEHDDREEKEYGVENHERSGRSLGFDRLLSEHRSYHNRSDTRRVDSARPPRDRTEHEDRNLPRRTWRERMQRDFKQRKTERENRHSNKRKEQDRIQSLVKRQLRIISHIVKMQHKNPRIVDRDVLSNRRNTIMLEDDKYRRRKDLGGENALGTQNLNSLDDMETFLDDLRKSNKKKILNDSGACNRLSQINKQLADLTTFFDGKDQFVSRDDIDIYKYDYADEKEKKLLYFSSKRSNPDKSDDMVQDLEEPKDKNVCKPMDHRQPEKRAESERSSGKFSNRERTKRKYSRSDHSDNNREMSPSKRKRRYDGFSECDEIERKRSSCSHPVREENERKSLDKHQQNSKNDEKKGIFSGSSQSESEVDVEKSYHKRRKTSVNHKNKRQYSGSSQSESEDNTRTSHEGRHKLRRKKSRKGNSPIRKQEKKRKRFLDEERTETEHSENNSSDESTVSMERRKELKSKRHKSKRSHVKSEESDASSGCSADENEESSYEKGEKSKRLSRTENSESEDSSDESERKHKLYKNNDFKRKKRMVLKKSSRDERKPYRRKKIKVGAEILKVKSKRGEPVVLADKNLAGKICLQLKGGQFYLKKSKEPNLESDEDERQNKLKTKNLERKGGSRTRKRRLRVRDTGTSLEDLESFLEELRAKKNETSKMDVELMSMPKLHSRETKFLDRVRAKRKAKLMACMGLETTDKTIAREAKFLAAMKKRTNDDTDHDEDESNVENERDKSELLQKLKAETKAILLGNKTEKGEIVRAKIQQATPDAVLEDVVTVDKVKKSSRRKRGRDRSYLSFRVKNANSLSSALEQSSEAQVEVLPDKAQGILNELRRKKKH